MSIPLFILAYVLLGIATAMRYHRATANGYGVDVIMTAFNGVFWWAALACEAVLGACEAVYTVWAWPRGERWARLKFELKRRIKR